MSLKRLTLSINMHTPKEVDIKTYTEKHNMLTTPYSPTASTPSELVSKLAVCLRWMGVSLITEAPTPFFTHWMGNAQTTLSIYLMQANPTQEQFEAKLNELLSYLNPPEQLEATLAQPNYDPLFAPFDPNLIIYSLIPLVLFIIDPTDPEVSLSDITNQARSIVLYEILHNQPGFDA